MNSYLIQKDDLQQFVFYRHHSQGQAFVGEGAAKIGLVKSDILLREPAGNLGDARVPARLKQED